jgi:hypothetical protein
MKVFVATESLGEDGDFSFTVPGELVHFPPVICDCPDCGCADAMAGFVSHKATTCFVVRDLDMGANTYVALLYDTLRLAGWVSEESEGDRAWAREWALEHLDIAADFPVETPLRFHRDTVAVRRAHPVS